MSSSRDAPPITIDTINFPEELPLKIGYLQSLLGQEEVISSDKDSSLRSGQHSIVLQSRDFPTDIKSLKLQEVTVMITLCTKSELRYYSICPTTLQKLLRDCGICWLWCPMNNDLIDNPNENLFINVAKAFQQAEKIVQHQIKPFLLFHGRPSNFYVTATAISCYAKLYNISVDSVLPLLNFQGDDKMLEKIKSFVGGFLFHYSELPPLVMNNQSKSLKRKLAATFPRPRNELETQLIHRSGILTITYGNTHVKTVCENFHFLFIFFDPFFFLFCYFSMLSFSKTTISLIHGIHHLLKGDIVL